MKILLAGIIIGLLSLSPAFAESSMDKKQKETDQNRLSEQTGEQRQTEQPVEQCLTEQTGERSQIIPESDSYQKSERTGEQDHQTELPVEQRRTEQTGEKTQKSDEGRQDATDQDRSYGQTGEGRQGDTDRARTHRATEVEPQEGYQRVTSDLITADDLQGANVYGSNNEHMADVKEVLMTTEGKVERVVVDVGGFFGIGARSVAIDLDEADIHKDADNDVRVYIPMSEEELRQMPKYNRGN